MKSRPLTKKELKKLFASNYGLVFRLMYELALRYVELHQLNYQDIIKSGSIHIKTAKGGLSRHIKISKRLRKKITETPEKEFYELITVGIRWLNYKIKNELHPDQKGVSTHSLRKTMAKKLYTKNKDLRFVQLWLGHKSLSNTSFYLDDNYEFDIDRLDKKKRGLILSLILLTSAFGLPALLYIIIRGFK